MAAATSAGAGVHVQPRLSKAAKLAEQFLDSSDDEDDEPMEQADTQEDTRLLEVDKYLALPQVDASSNFDLLEWWRMHQTMFPNLAKMARQYLALPATSASVERLFSAGGEMHSDKRKMTKEESLQQLLFVHKNG